MRIRTIALIFALGLLAAPVSVEAQQGIPTFLSGIIENSREIFLRGRAMGNRANVFSNIGPHDPAVGADPGEHQWMFKH